ncbi:MAG: thiamine phosphate synthase [Paludibacteraceae bacterium]|nr:thiamine phosphate synthase [Paludibacteraceae bacterium]
MNADQLFKFNLQFITHFNEKYSYLDSANLALQGGCKWVQLRMKDASDDEFMAVAKEVLPLCKKNDAVFLVDDRVELCKKLGADGVHLGKNDMHPADARQILGPDFIIGGTCNTFDDVQRIANDVDYIGCGPFRYTTTKKNLAPVLGLKGYTDIVWEMRSQGINIPIVAIGGITCADIPQILETGVNGIALSGTILNADDPVKEAKNVLSTIFASPTRSFLFGDTNEDI